MSEDICQSAEQLKNKAVKDQQNARNQAKVLSENVYAKIQESKEVEKSRTLRRILLILQIRQICYP